MAEQVLPEELERRIRIYEDPANDPGGFKGADWAVIIGTGIVLPTACILIGWNVGWPA